MKKLKAQKTLQGREIALYGNGGKCKNLIIGVFHGDEPQGKFLIEKYLENNSESSLYFIPCLNPDGMAVMKRTNASGVDLNRNFPTNNWQYSAKDEFFGGESPASEIETKFVMEILDEYKPQLILTLHAPFKVVNFDGNAIKTGIEFMGQKLGESIIILASEKTVAVKVSDSFVKKGINAGKIVGEIARATGANGGGRPNFAQGGVKDASKLDEILARVEADYLK